MFADEAGTVERARAARHVHTAAQVVRLLHSAGFGDVQLLGADGTTPYALGAPRMIAVATARIGGRGRRLPPAAAFHRRGRPLARARRRDDRPAKTR